MFEQLKQKYASSFAEKVAHIQQAISSNDVHTLSVLVHQMAGSSGSYGYDEICHCCQEIEELLHENDQLNAAITEKTTQLMQLMSATNPSAT